MGYRKYEHPSWNIPSKGAQIVRSGRATYVPLSIDITFTVRRSIPPNPPAVSSADPSLLIMVNRFSGATGEHLSTFCWARIKARKLAMKRARLRQRISLSGRPGSSCAPSRRWDSTLNNQVSKYTRTLLFFLCHAGLSRTSYNLSNHVVFIQSHSGWRLKQYPVLYCSGAGFLHICSRDLQLVFFSFLLSS